MALGQATRIRVSVATRIQLDGLKTEAQVAAEAYAAAIQNLTRSQVLPAQLLGIASYVVDALADLDDRVQRHLASQEVDHAA